jgi:hypothetical protein
MQLGWADWICKKLEHHRKMEHGWKKLDATMDTQLDTLSAKSISAKNDALRFQLRYAVFWRGRSGSKKVLIRRGAQVPLVKGSHC